MNLFSEVEKGKKSDASELAELFVRCTVTLINMNIMQWDYTYPLQEHVEVDIQAGELFLIRQEGRIAATISLNEDQHPQYLNVKWPSNALKVLVIHRLGVHPDFGRRGLGNKMIAFADYFAIINNYDAIRLDAYSGNHISKNMYIKHGYEQADGLCYFRGNIVPFYCWEKKI